MTETEFVNQALNLKSKINGVKVSMERLQRLFGFAFRELRNKNDVEARKIFSRYWHQHNQEFRVFHNLSEHEIYTIITNRSRLPERVAKFAQMGWSMTFLANRINSWILKGQTLYSVLQLCQSAGTQNKRAEAQTIRERIEDMRQSKNEMVRVFNTAKQLAVIIAVPFISDYLSMNVSIFTELSALCDKVADYSLKIAEEAEKTLGTNGELMNSLRNKNSWLSQTMKIQAESKAHKH